MNQISSIALRRDPTDLDGHPAADLRRALHMRLALAPAAKRERGTITAGA